MKQFEQPLSLSVVSIPNRPRITQMARIKRGGVALASIGLLCVPSLFADGVKWKEQFPHVISFELGASGFAHGDQIIITSVRGDRKHIEAGGGYLVEGTYTLASYDSAMLALFCTTQSGGGHTTIQDGEQMRITKGSGKFHLYEIDIPDVWLHVSFYPKHSARGGVYFGEKGREDTIMRNQEWFSEFFSKPEDASHRLDAIAADKTNRALLDYLGEPVPVPANMDARYDKENLLKAFTDLCHKADFVITKLAVDDSEFPFLVYGTLDGAHTLPAKLFDDEQGYAYGGSVRGSTGEGSTYFAVNMIPRSQYPQDQEKACNRRLMIRLQMLADKAQ
jgi:hypothetical protein